MGWDFYLLSAISLTSLLWAIVSIYKNFSDGHKGIRKNIGNWSIYIFICSTYYLLKYHLHIPAIYSLASLLLFGIAIVFFLRLIAKCRNKT